jgi:hypothetical protein
MSIKINAGVTLGAGTNVKVPLGPPTLTVNLAGDGNGFVASSPAGISGSGSATFARDTQVTLQAAAAPGSSFAGWSGAASGTAPAHITMDQDQTVTATFNLNVSLVSIEVTPTGVHLPSGFSKQMTATALFSNGSNQNYTSQVTWSSPGVDVLSVDSNGVVTGSAPGTTTVGAGYGFIIGTTTVTITDSVLVAITISPTNPAVARDSTIQLTATGMFSDGTTLDITTQATWSSSDDAIATIDNNGVVAGHSGGNCTISVNRNGVSDSKTLFVGN